ncbi:MAG TPA: DUF1684 domain-containing protein [Gaiellaceae bacterium]|nr:DUF1684 domain-containing protein [Gaiellaceae bacterium]
MTTLLDWRRRVFDLYRDVRSDPDPRHGWDRWRAVRDELLTTHPQSPLAPEERDGYPGAPYFDYDPRFRVTAKLVDAEQAELDIQTSRWSTYRFTRLARAEFELEGRRLSLDCLWLQGYGGGLFLPFGDASNGATTYGAGRYLLDTVKGADLGQDGDALVLDFNFAYNPSCVYNPRWVCPLAPAANRLPVEVEAGERSP